jgi:hypothetical protein
MMRRCSYGKHDAPASAFSPDPTRRSGLSSRCRACDAAKARAYYATHRAERLAYAGLYYERHRAARLRSNAAERRVIEE